MNLAQFYEGLLVFGVATGGAPPPTGALLAVNNLSDVPNKPLALTNLGALPIAGGTMTGALTLAGDPVSNLQPVTLQYFNAHSGGGTVTLTGDVTGSGSGTVATTISNGAVTLSKLANLSAQSLIGNASGTSGAAASVPFSTFLLATNNLSDLVSASAARTNLQLGSAAIQTASANTGVVASVAGGITIGNLASFVDVFGTITDSGITISDVAKLSGSTFTGTVTLASDPVSSLQAATKQYVDAQVAPSVSTWTLVSGTSQAMVPGTGYVANNSAQVQFTLPTSCPFGYSMKIAGLGVGGWKINQGTSQQILFGNTSSTAGTGGSLAATLSSDYVEVLCVTANTVFKVLSSQGTLLAT